MKYLEKYEGKKVAVLFSAGFDSSFLAHHLNHTAKAAAVSYIVLDYGPENSPQSRFFDPSRRVDVVNDIDQYEHYANLQNECLVRAGKQPLPIWVMRFPELRSMTVEPSNLLECKDPNTRREENHTLTFYAGYVFNYLVQALSVAAKFGYDYVVTGHMGWNTHYEDESSEFADTVNKVFAQYYGRRLRVCPKVEMPFREHNIKKSGLVYDNDRSEHPMNPRFTISCNSSLENVVDGVPTSFKKNGPFLIHCGQCLHCKDRIEAFSLAGVKDNAFFADNL